MVGLSKTNRHSGFDYIKNYRFNSIFIKNLLQIFITVILPFFCVTCLALFLYTNYQEKQVSNAFENESNRICSSLDSMLEEVKMKAIMLGANNSLSSVISHKNKDSVEAEIVNLSETLSVYKLSSRTIDSIYLYFPEDEFIISQAGLTQKKKFFDLDALTAANSGDHIFDFCYLERMVSNKQKKTLTMVYKCHFPQNQTVLIFMNMDIKKIKDYLGYSEDINVTLQSDDYTLYCDSFLAEKLSKSDDNAESTLHTTMSIGSGLELQIESIYPPYSDEILVIRRIFFLTLGLTTFASIVLVFFISKQIYSPIKEIMDLLSKEDLFPVEEKKILQNSNELQYIMASITASARSKNMAEKVLIEKIALLKKAQAIALQSQINPHFLNNTLETINWMAIRQLGRENDISAMINALSSLLRISLSNTDVFSTIRSEKQMAETYLFIQQSRFNDQIQVEWNIPEYLMDCKIVKVVLQPIIENAIKYGMPSTEGINLLKIQAHEDNNVITLSVSDSGLGMLPEESEKINTAIHENVIKESSHIGLSNVHQRLVLAFGAEYGLSFSSQINCGTTVSIRIPYQA